MALGKLKVHDSYDFFFYLVRTVSYWLIPESSVSLLGLQNENLFFSKKGLGLSGTTLAKLLYSPGGGLI